MSGGASFSNLCAKTNQTAFTLGRHPAIPLRRPRQTSTLKQFEGIAENSARRPNKQRDCLHSAYSLLRAVLALTGCFGEALGESQKYEDGIKGPLGAKLRCTFSYVLLE